MTLFGIISDFVYEAIQVFLLYLRTLSWLRIKTYEFYHITFIPLYSSSQYCLT